MISSGPIVCDIEPRIGARLRQITIDTTPILVAAAPDVLDWGMYPMVPYAGRVRRAILEFDGASHDLPMNAPPHAIHGTVFDVPWSTVSSDATSMTMEASTGDRWPFPATVTHAVTVTEFAVRCELSIEAHVRMPVQLGWHPWFARPDRVTASFASMLQKDAEGITTLDRVEPASPPVDDCFFEPDAWPRIEIGDVTVEIASDCPWWVRYDAPSGDVCIEPQSGPPNGVNTRPFILEADGRWTRWMEIRHVTGQ